MDSIKYIKEAIDHLDTKVQKIIIDQRMPLNEKDALMLPLSREKRVLKQTLEDLEYLEAHPPTQSAGCKSGMINNEE